MGPRKATSKTAAAAASKKKAPSQQTLTDMIQKSDRTALRRTGKEVRQKKKDQQHKDKEDEDANVDEAELEESEHNDGCDSAANELQQEEKDSTTNQQVQSSASTANKDVAVKRVLTETYLSSAGNSSELSRRLKQTWMSLQQVPNAHQPQEDEDAPSEEVLRLVCAELMHPKIMQHNEQSVRSLAACCLVELLRVFAPEMPFKCNEELYAAFQLIFEQLRCLAVDKETVAKSSCDIHCFHVLESLATVKSCLLVVGVDYVPDDDRKNNDPLVVQLFQTLFQTIQKEHSVKIQNLMVTIMVACIEASDIVDQPLLDVILRPLVNSNITTPGIASEESDGATSSNSNAMERGPYHMAQELIRRTSDQLQGTLSHFFNAILVDSAASSALSSSTTGSKTSDLKEHVYALIYEIHKINSSLLLYVLPSVCMQLQVDEVATRSDAITLMGKLFASSHADYGHQYMKSFREFLGRFRDVSKEIRLQMIQVCVHIWERKQELATTIEKEFILRLSDTEWEVRQQVVREVCDLAANHLELVSEECLRQVGERMKDKRIVLRKETMTGLSQVYGAHVSAYWASEDEEEEEADGPIDWSNIPATHVKKLGWVPDFVLKCYAYPQQELKLRVVQLLDDFLLPKGFTESIRAKGLVYMFHSLDQASKEALRRILHERAQCLQLCRTFVMIKRQQRQRSKGSEVADADLEKVKRQVIDGLTPLFPDDAVGKLLDQLIKWKDQSVFKKLALLCDVSKNQDESRLARDQLVKSVGSKSSMGEFMKKLCRKLNLLTVSQASVGTLLELLIHVNGYHAKENRDVIELLQMVSKVLPDLLSPYIREEFEAILVGNGESTDSMQDKSTSDEDESDEPNEQKDTKVIIGVLGVLAVYSRHWRKQQEENTDDLSKDDEEAVPSASLSKHLQQYCLSEIDTKQLSFTPTMQALAAKLAATSIANFYNKSKETSLLVHKLSSKKKLGSPVSQGILSTLQCLEVFAKRCSHVIANNKAMLSNIWSVLNEDFIFQRGSSDQGLDKPQKSKTGTTATRVTAKLIEIRSLAVNVAVNLLLFCHSEADTSIQVERSQDIIKLLLDTLRSDGKVWTSNAALAAKCRTMASCYLLKLMRNKHIEATVTVSDWHVLGFAMQDSNEEVRSAFLKKVTSHLMKQTVPHPHKYLSYLALAATETNMNLKKIAKNVLSASVERMRRMFEASSARIYSSFEGSLDRLGNPASNEARPENVTALMVPEYSLPYVIHLLAHHPDFPKKLAERNLISSGSLVQNPLWNEQLLYLNFFLDGLVSSNPAEVDNIAFLIQILTKLSECHDITSPSDGSIYPLIGSAVALLQRKIKSQLNLKAFPGKIYLPKQLFGPGNRKNAHLDTTTHGSTDATSEHFIGNEPQKKQGRRILTSLSPIKATGFNDHFMMLNSPPASTKKRKSPSTSTQRRKSPKNGRSESRSHHETISEGKSSTSPPRRSSLMRKARAQAPAYVGESSDSADDPEDFVPNPSVASRLNKIGVDDIEVSKPSSQKRMSGEVAVNPEQTQNESDDEEMTSFRTTRRRRHV